MVKVLKSSFSMDMYNYDYDLYEIFVSVTLRNEGPKTIKAVRFDHVVKIHSQNSYGSTTALLSGITEIANETIGPSQEKSFCLALNNNSNYSCSWAPHCFAAPFDAYLNHITLFYTDGSEETISVPEPSKPLTEAEKKRMKQERRYEIIDRIILVFRFLFFALLSVPVILIVIEIIKKFLE